MLKRLFLYFSVSLVLILVITSLNKSFSAKKQAVKEALGQAPQLFSQALLSQQQPEALPDGKNADDGVASSLPEADPQFRIWFTEESQLVNARGLDQEAKAQEISEKMKRASRSNIEYLKQKSLDLTASQKERLLSTYMLTLGGAASKQALIDIASQPLQTPSPAEPHSLDELQLNGEKSLKVSAIDAIFDSTESLEQKLKDLEEIKSHLTDPFLVNYAQQKINNLKSQL